MYAIRSYYVRFGGQPAGEQRLLLIAAGKLSDRFFGVRGADAELLDVLVGHRRLRTLRQVAKDAASGLQRQDDVLADRQVGNDAFRLAVFRAEGDAFLDRLARRVEVDRFAVDGNRSRLGTVSYNFV